MMLFELPIDEHNFNNKSCSKLMLVANKALVWWSKRDNILFKAILIPTITHKIFETNSRFDVK